MAARQPHYSPKQLAESLAVSESSVKRWCDAGKIPTIRTLGGHRRVPLDGLQQFLRQTSRRLSHPEALGLPSLAADRENVVICEQADSQQRAFGAFLAAGDEFSCRRILRERILDGWTRAQATEDLITAAFREIGDAWACGQLDVYQERRGCEICLRLVSEMRSALPAPRHDAPVAIGGTPEGDLYQLPTAMVELALREAGWRATNLGSNLPLESFHQAAHDYQPKLVWLSVSVVEDEAKFTARLNQVIEFLGPDTALLLGGRALTDTLRSQLNYTSYGSDLSQLVELAATLEA